MDVLRTAIVLVLLLALGYGVWVVLNQDGGVETPEDFGGWNANGEVADGGASGFGNGPFVPPAASADESPAVAIEAGGAALGSPSGFAEIPGDTIPGQPAYPGGTAQPAAPKPPYERQVESGAPETGFPPPPPGFNSGGAATPDLDNSAGSDPNLAPNASDPVVGGYGDEVSTPSDSGSRYDSGPSSPNRDSSGGSTAETAGPATDLNNSAADANPASNLPAATITAFDEAMNTANQQLENQQEYDALYTLSLMYGDPGLAADERRELLKMLDPLAGKVIYSTEHLLEPAYQVQRGEDLFGIADRLGVPHNLLQNINGVKDPRVLTPGTTLKVVQGPFRAEVDLTKQELTLFLGKLYAGRFPITLGAEPVPRPGEFEVRGKETGKAYYGASGATFAADHPNNPYGRYWIDLGSQFSIHGTASIGGNRGMGCVSLSPVDAADVFGILSKGSKVLFRR